MLVAIEGIDGSGKGTQSRALVERLRDAGRKVDLLSFPRYEATVFGRAVGEFLNGRFGSLDTVSPFLAALLYAGDRFESRELLQESLDRHDVVVLDRYVASNVAHQGAKLSGAERRRLVDWIEEVEYRVFGLPRADRTILLDLPAETAQKLIATKPPRSYTDRTADLQEADSGYLEAVREVYRELAEESPGWSIVECVRDGRIRSVAGITDEVLALACN